MEIGLRNPDIGSLAGYLTIEDNSKRSVGYQALAYVIARFLITFKDKEEKGIYDINNQKFINCFLNMLNEATIIDMSYLKFLIKNTLSFLEYRNNEDFISAVTSATSYTEIIFLDRFFTRDTIANIDKHLEYYKQIAVLAKEAVVKYASMRLVKA